MVEDMVHEAEDAVELNPMHTKVAVERNQKSGVLLSDSLLVFIVVLCVVGGVDINCSENDEYQKEDGSLSFEEV